MTRHRTAILSLLAAGLLLTAGWVQSRDTVRYTFQEGSRLWFEGTSTIHDYTCEAAELTGWVEGDDSVPTQIARVEVAVPVQKLACGNTVMDRRMHSVLKASQHPDVQYRLSTLRVLTGEGQNAFRLQTSGRLSIAGVEKPLTMNVDGERMANGQIQFKGSTPLLMSEFGITPPAFLNLKTADELTVHFEIIAGR
jgi:polyisoprenoid-binding protein YceI